MDYPTEMDRQMAHDHAQRAMGKTTSSKLVEAAAGWGYGPAPRVIGANSAKPRLDPRDQELRAQAIEFALRSHVRDDHTEVLKAAKAYEAYLRGEGIGGA